MSASASIRGYLLQTVVALLNALNERSEWVRFAIEPEHFSEKIDIVWHLEDGSNHVVQVKSSQNQFKFSDVEKWAKETKQESNDASSYELIILSHSHPPKVANINEIDDVKISLKQLNIAGMIQQAAHKLDWYLENKNFSKVPSLVRELIIEGLVSKLKQASVDRITYTREAFDAQIREWVLAIYPDAIDGITQTYCEVLGNTVWFIPEKEKPLVEDHFFMGMPLEFINTGKQAAIIECLELVLEYQKKTIRFRIGQVSDPDLEFEQNGKNIKFSISRQIAILPNQALRKMFWFYPFQLVNGSMSDFIKSCANSGYKVNLFVKYRGRPSWMLQLQIEDNDRDKEIFKKISDGVTQYKLFTPKTGPI